MVAYREIVNSQEDILHIVNMLKEIKEGAEVIIVPFEKAENKIANKKNQKSLKGVFNSYANNSKVALEESAWQNHILEKYDKCISENQ